MSAPVSDRLAGGLVLVRAEIVEHDNVAGLQRGGQGLLGISGEDCAVDRPVDDQGSLDPVVAERGDKGERLPVACRCRSESPQKRRLNIPQV
jgi:hypothetical protein